MDSVTLAQRPGRSKARHVPRAPLPGLRVTSTGAISSASRQRALPLLHHSYGLMRQTKTLPSYAIPLLEGSWQVVASPCWEMALPDVVSAILVWVLGSLPRHS